MQKTNYLRALGGLFTLLVAWPFSAGAQTSTTRPRPLGTYTIQSSA